MLLPLFSDGNRNMILFDSLQPAFYPWSTVCILLSVYLLPTVVVCDYQFMICSLKVKNSSEYTKDHI